MVRWEPTERTDIVARFLKGETATEIARAYRPFRPTVTRNAVLGVLHRAGVLGQGRAQIQSQPTARQRSRAALPAPRPALPAPVVEGAVAYVAPVEVESVSSSAFGRNPGDRRAGTAIPIRPPGASSAPLLQLARTACRFPVGEPEPGRDRLFCGEPATEGPYCARCRSFAYAPEAPRSSERDLMRIARRAS